MVHVRSPTHQPAYDPIPRNDHLSIQATFQVARLVGSFRRRTKLKAAQSTPTTLNNNNVLESTFCDQYEQKSIEEIDRYLAQGLSLSTEDNAILAGLDDPCAAMASEDSRRDSVLMTNSTTSPHGTIIDGGIPASLWPTIHSAAEDRHFLRNAGLLDVDIKSLEELQETLRAIERLLKTMQSTDHVPKGHDLVSLLGLEQGSYDSTTVANLEHILLCLRFNLVHFLFDCGYEQVKHIIECQRDQFIHTEDWFAEFPDARHPLSTTWPWSIKPSLAVIWGVCWMFYWPNDSADEEVYRRDAHGNTYNQQGQLVYANTDPSFDHHDVAGAEAGSERPPISAGQAGRDQQATAMPRTFSTTQPHSNVSFPEFEGAQFDFPPRPTYTRVPQPQQSQTHGASGITTPHNDNYTSSAAADLSAFNPISGRINQDYSATGYAPAAYQHTNLPRPQFPAPPSITVDTANLPPTSAANLTLYSAPAHIAPAQASTFNFPQLSGNLSPHHPYMNTETMQTPVSREGSNAPSTTSRPRSHSDTSIARGPFSPQPPRTSSIVSIPGSSPQPHQPPRRAEPIVNEFGQFLCTYSKECAHLTFDRRCEWSKHMDKHDRPYRCHEPGCSKLQGFTYSGGLLRHEREVHAKHGGPKERLMCPVEDCKRHTGNGFTRKENLHEHMRRVHKRKPSESSVKLEEEVATPMSDSSDLTRVKRRKLSTSPAYQSDTEADHLRQINRNLRRQAEEQASYIEKLEADLREAQMKLSGQFRPV